MSRTPAANQLSLLEREPACPLLLISLHEQWHQAIAEGRKRYEFRRLFIDKSSTALVYVTGLRGLAAIAQFDAPVRDTPEALAQLAEDDMTGSGAMILDYFAGRESGLAVPILAYHTLPLIALEALRTLDPPIHPPQSYVYADRRPDLLDLVREQAEWAQKLA